jgi:hypothetical protein
MNTSNKMTAFEKEKLSEILDSLKDKIPSTFIARKKAPAVAGYSISAGTLANLDSAGQGVEGRFYMGKTACYPIDAFITFLKKRAGL